MQTAGIKKQWTKLQALTTVLPKKVIEQLKKILRKKESEHTGNDSYLKVKKEVLRIFKPSEDVAFERAMSRVLTTTPGDLARALVNDLCDHDLDGCCCHRFILGTWKRQLPSAVKQAISSQPFNSANFNNILDLADKCYASTRPAGAAIAAITTNSSESSPLEEAFHPYWTNNAIEGAVSAYGYGQRGGAHGGFRGGRAQGRGQGRGQPGSRGNGRGGRGGQNQNSSNNRGQGQGTGGHPRHKTPRHADLPPFESCFRHWTHGKSAHFCMEPGSCPWKQYWVPKSNNQ